MRYQMFLVTPVVALVVDRFQVDITCAQLMILATAPFASVHAGRVFLPFGFVELVAKQKGWSFFPYEKS
jgi:hypothetical protein